MSHLCPHMYLTQSLPSRRLPPSPQSASCCLCKRNCASLPTTFPCARTHAPDAGTNTMQPGMPTHLYAQSTTPAPTSIMHSASQGSSSLSYCLGAREQGRDDLSRYVQNRFFVACNFATTLTSAPQGTPPKLRKGPLRGVIL
jgi:hypothetical protein